MAEDNEWYKQDGYNPSREKIAVDEYTNIIKSFYDFVLRPVVNMRQMMDRDALDMITSELEWKVQDNGFEKLPYNTQNAYKSLLKLANTLKETDDEVIEEHRDILDGHFHLGISCHVYGDCMSTVYKGKNPCRSNQIRMYSALQKARRNAESKGISLPILESSAEMFDVCKKCPYK